MMQMFDFESSFKLTLVPTSERPSLQRIEDICHRVMLTLLEIEEERSGDVHSAAVSAVGAEGELLIEFCVDAESMDDASDIAGEVLRELIEGRLNQRFTEKTDDLSEEETSRHLDLVSV